MEKYVKMQWIQDKIIVENLSRVTPLRSKMKGQALGLTGKESQGGVGPEDKGLWIYQEMEIYDWEIMKLIAATLVIAITSSFQLNIYICGGKG